MKKKLVFAVIAMVAAAAGVAWAIAKFLKRSGSSMNDELDYDYYMDDEGDEEALLAESNEASYEDLLVEEPDQLEAYSDDDELEE